MISSVTFWLAVAVLVTLGVALVSLLVAAKRGDLGRAAVEREFRRCLERGGLRWETTCPKCHQAKPLPSGGTIGASDIQNGGEVCRDRALQSSRAGGRARVIYRREIETLQPTQESVLNLVGRKRVGR